MGKKRNPVAQFLRLKKIIQNKRGVSLKRTIMRELRKGAF